LAALERRNIRDFGAGRIKHTRIGKILAASTPPVMPGR